MQNLEETLASFWFSDESSCNILHENREILPEPRPLLSEQRGLRNATRIDGRECNACGAVEAFMKHVGSHHEGQFGIFVHLGPIEIVSVHHGDWILAAELQAFKVFKVSNRIDAATTDSVVIPSDRTNHDNAGIRGTFHHRHDLGSEKKMAKVIDLQLLFVSVFCPLWIVQRWLINSSIACQPIYGTVATKSIQFLNEFVH
mmetsp:Transcript_33218/g.65475  ORF Transcript_33218/g.65475 Transcript_33218/m.65475 type:complete len:201 (-) Transcript_33218:410-1012(-)